MQPRQSCIEMANRCNDLCRICGTACIAALGFLLAVALSRLSCELREQIIRGMQPKKSTWPQYSPRPKKSGNGDRASEVLIGGFCVLEPIEQPCF